MDELRQPVNPAETGGTWKMDDLSGILIKSDYITLITVFITGQVDLLADG